MNLKDRVVTITLNSSLNIQGEATDKGNYPEKKTQTGSKEEDPLKLK